MASILNAKQIQSLLKKGNAGRYPAGNGLYFRVSKAGSASWFYRYTLGRKRREISVGKYPAMSLAKANVRLAELKDNVTEGIDPLAEKKRIAENPIKTVDDLAKDWFENDLDKRLKHPGIPRRIYRKDIAPFIGEMSVDRVSPLDIRGIFDRISQSGRPAISNDSLMYCKQLFRHGVRLNLLTHNPAEPFTMRHAGGLEKSRSRVLSLEELRMVFEVLKEHPTTFSRENYLCMAILVVLGVRKGELTVAMWEEFDFDELTWAIPSSRSKTGIGIVIPLPREVVGWLEELKIRSYGSLYVFPNRSKSGLSHMSSNTLNHALAKMFGASYKKSVKSENYFSDKNIEHFVVHDLRRTCRSLLAGNGVPGHIAERCLNHKLKGVEGIYDRYDYFEERKIAMQNLAQKVGPLV